MCIIKKNQVKKAHNLSINRTVESGFSLRFTPLSTAGYFSVIFFGEADGV